MTQFHSFHFSAPRSPTQGFKGIALFTPGGDLVYCIDLQKRDRWHLHLCALLQELLGLSEPPHFLVPCYSASLDCWLSAQTQQLQTVAEACPMILQHQAILNALFGTPHLVWQPSSPAEGLCDPLMLNTYRRQFPQLWENHDLIVRLEPATLTSTGAPESWSPLQSMPKPQGYVLRLYVSETSGMTERILQSLHQLLEKALQQPYTLKVVDIHKHPEQAEADQITATPTLVRVYPPPTRRLVGDLDNLSKILQVLSTSELAT